MLMKNNDLHDLHCVCDVQLFCMCACFFAKIETLPYNITDNITVAMFITKFLKK